MPGVETIDFKPEIAELAHAPRRHRSGLPPNQGVRDESISYITSGVKTSPPAVLCLEADRSEGVATMLPQAKLF